MGGSLREAAPPPYSLLAIPYSLFSIDISKNKKLNQLLSINRQLFLPTTYSLFSGDV